ncbi:MAG TPA: glycoside hydrolase family 3 N-terminal domain-containing protein, partial [Puia sp.]|nr:glycoside hydrolase family 3 N-terminal domain-containing protein [Puia sp.]
MIKIRRRKPLLLLSLLVCCFIHTRAQQIPPYLDSTLSVEARITDLLPRLTLEEKVQQLSDSWGSKGIPRLKVPAMLKTEGLHGQSYSTGATIFPQAIEMASSFDTALVHDIGKTTAVESRAAGLRVSWSPVLDVARDVRWGRVEETYGEDPYLVSRMGVAWIDGFQGQGMIAVPKHFAGHGEPLGGRDSHDVGLSDRTMRNVHLVPFRAAIREAHAGGVMAAYSTWDGVPDNGSRELLQKILREEWGFDGIVVSDCSAEENFYRKQSVVDNPDEAVKMAILAGVDIECGSVNAHTLAGAVRRGVLKESDLDVNLRRVFRAKYRLGLFDRPGPDKMNWEKLPVYDIPPHRALARQAAVEGSVLLKNDQVLPLSKDIRTIAVIGPTADSVETGDYSAKAAAGQLVTVLQGVRSHVSARTKVLYAKGCGVLSMDSSGFGRAVEMASRADVVILAVGGHSGENVDGATLEIPGVQRRLIRRIAATGKPVVLVLVNGKPFTLSWESEHLAAILETWYPGEEGGDATADILFGDVNPSGRLPVTFPRHVGQLPLHYNYLPSGRNYDYYDMPFSPLYRFGYGLSYTTFNYSNLRTAFDGDTVLVSADIENTGNRAGDEVAQLYLTDVVSSVITPVISLKGFQRVHLDKGEKKTVVFQILPYQLSLLNASMERVVEPGVFRVHVGGVSPEPPSGNTGHKLKIGFTDPREGVSGEFEMKKAYAALFVPSVSVAPAAGGGEDLTVTVANEGNLTDVADIKIYADSLLDDHRSEIDPGQSMKHTFHVTLHRSGQQNITVLVGKKLLTAMVTVAASQAGPTHENASPLAGAGNGREQRVGVVGLALENPRLYLDFDEGAARDRVSGELLKVQGAGYFAGGRKGKAFYSKDKNAFIAAGGIDVYRKSWT